MKNEDNDEDVHVDGSNIEDEYKDEQTTKTQIKRRKLYE